MINTWNSSIHRVSLDSLFIMRHFGVYFLCHPTSKFLTYERGKDKPVEVHFFPPHFSAATQSKYAQRHKNEDAGRTWPFWHTDSRPLWLQRSMSLTSVCLHNTPSQSPCKWFNYMKDRNHTSWQSGILPDIWLKSVTSRRKDGRWQESTCHPHRHSHQHTTEQRARLRKAPCPIYQVNPDDEHSKCTQWPKGAFPCAFGCVGFF